MSEKLEKPVETWVLGSGTSTGVPLIGCPCAVCQSTDEKDRRLRPSVYVTDGEYGLLIDASPDFRQQAMREPIPFIHAILLTHPHADHLFGLDDIRQFNLLQKDVIIDAYARDFTMEGLRRIFGYIVDPPVSQKGLFRPKMAFHELQNDPIQVGPFEVRSMAVPHGPDQSSAFRLTYAGRSFVYVPDCSVCSEELITFMQAADCVMIDGLRQRPHPGHLTIDRAVEAMRAAHVKRGYVTHICHDFTHAQLVEMLPTPFSPAYDRLRISW